MIKSIKNHYKTQKRFGGEEGVWTDAPELDVDVIDENGDLRVKIDLSKDNFYGLDIIFFENGKKFAGSMKEKDPKQGWVDYRGVRN